MINFLEKSKDSSKKNISNSLIKGFTFFFFVAISALVLSYLFLDLSNLPANNYVTQITDIWNLLLGLPVTAAGAVIAIILAQKAIDISKNQEHLEEQNLRLNTKFSEYEFKQTLTDKWEYTVSQYSSLYNALDTLTEKLNELKYWHHNPKNYLSFAGSELSLLSKGNVQDAIYRHIESGLSPNELKDKLMSALNCYQCDSLTVSDNTLLFNAEKNTELAYINYKEFYHHIEEHIAPSLNVIERILREMNHNAFLVELWKKKYDSYKNNNSFMLDNALQLLKKDGYKFTIWEEKEFCTEIYSSPFSLANKIKRYKNQLLSSCGAKRLFLISNRSINQVDPGESTPSMLDFVVSKPVNEQEQPISINCGFKTVQPDHNFYESNTFWDELEPELTVETEEWVSTSRLVFQDLIRLLPQGEDVRIWAENHFILSPAVERWICKDLCFDIKELYRSSRYLSPFGAEWGEDYLGCNLDLTDKNISGSIYRNALGQRVQFVSSQRFINFLKDTFNSIGRKQVSYKSLQDADSLRKTTYQNFWNQRKPKSNEESLIVASYKALHEEMEAYCQLSEEMVIPEDEDLLDILGVEEFLDIYGKEKLIEVYGLDKANQILAEYKSRKL